MIDEDRIKEIAQDAAGVYDCCAFANPAFIEDAILKALSEERAQRAEGVPLNELLEKVATAVGHNQHRANGDYARGRMDAVTIVRGYMNSGER